MPQVPQGFKAAIDYIEKVGFDYIGEREIALTSRAIEKMKKIPHVNIIGSENADEHTGIVTFTIDNVHPHDISEILAADG